MDFQNNRQDYGNMQPQIPGNAPYPGRPARQENAMSTAAMVTGILSIVSIFLLPVYLPLFFAGISIVLAFLSRGADRSLTSRAKAGFITALCSIFLNLAVMILFAYLLIHVPAYRQQFEELYEQMYGESLDDAMDDAFGIAE